MLKLCYVTSRVGGCPNPFSFIFKRREVTDMDILIAVLVEAVKTLVTQTIVLIFSIISTNERKKKTTRTSSKRIGRSSKKKY